jgi:hypothetical protein
VDNRYLLGTKALGSYLHRYSNGELESFPVFSLENPERICAGGQTMVRYPICGFMEDGEIRQDKDVDLKALFSEANRVAIVSEEAL